MDRRSRRRTARHDPTAGAGRGDPVGGLGGMPLRRPSSAGSGARGECGHATAGAGAAFFFELRRFSAGGCRSLFLRFGSTIDRTNFLSPWSSNLITIYSSLQERTLPNPNLGCSTCAPCEYGGLFAI